MQIFVFKLSQQLYISQTSTINIKNQLTFITLLSAMHLMLRLFCFILHTYTKKYCSNPQGNLTKKKKQNPIVEIDRDHENSTKSPKSGNTGYLSNT